MLCGFEIILEAAPYKIAPVYLPSHKPFKKGEQKDAGEVKTKL